MYGADGRQVSALSKKELERALVESSEYVVYAPADVTDEIRNRARRRATNQQIIIAMGALNLQSIAVTVDIGAMLLGFIG
ncbi:MAG: hypothetical protein F4Z40_00295 [Chloroflexi bacterium]|nr:hypothetical protein [Chloroflexota bacterium]